MHLLLLFIFLYHQVNYCHWLFLCFKLLSSIHPSLFHIFGKLYSAVVETLGAIATSGSQAWNADTIAVARSLKLAIIYTQWKFLISFVVSKNGLAYAKAISVSLQSIARTLVRSFEKFLLCNRHSKSLGCSRCSTQGLACGS